MKPSLVLLAVLAQAMAALATPPEQSQTNIFAEIHKDIPDGNPGGLVDFRTIASDIAILRHCVCG